MAVWTAWKPCRREVFVQIVPWDSDRAAEIIAEHALKEGPTLPILHGLQKAFGYIPDEAIPMVARALNLSRAEIHGVVSFYHDFRHAPAGRHVLKLCRAEACQSMGAEPLAAHVKARLGADWGETAADGSITLEPVFCLGLCACAPSGMMDGRVMGRLDKSRIDTVIAKAAAP